MRNFALIAVAMGCILVSSFFSAANASSFIENYGTFSGEAITFKNVTEESSTHAVAQFGQPDISGNSLTFSPNSFGVYASYGSSDIASSKISMVVSSVGARVLDKINFAEGGDYSLIGSKGNSSTRLGVSSPLTVTILKIDGLSITPVQLYSDMTFSPSEGTFDLLNDKGRGIAWHGTTTFDLTSTLRGLGLSGYATEIAVNWQTILTAESQAGTIAYIKAKEAGSTGITITTSVVPEPVTLLSLTAAAAGLGAYIRRRRASICLAGGNGMSRGADQAKEPEQC